MKKLNFVFLLTLAACSSINITARQPSNLGAHTSTETNQALSDSNPLNGCQRPPAGLYLRLGADGKILARCLPNTVYSWGPFAKIELLQKLIGEASWDERPFAESTNKIVGIYTVADPIGSFAYGDYSIRIKLKPDVQFVYQQGLWSCDQLSAEQKKNSVLIKIWNETEWTTAAEYIICSPHVIESWSYGTTEHYEEILRDAEYVKSHPGGEYLSYLREQGKPIIFGANADSMPFTEEHFKKVVELHKGLSGKNGKVYARPDSEELLESHFKNKWDVYFSH